MSEAFAHEELKMNALTPFSVAEKDPDRDKVGLRQTGRCQALKRHSGADPP